MWSSSSANNSNGASNTSPSKSSSSCSFPSSPSTPNKKSMEEVWNDLGLTSLQDHSSTTIPKTASNPNFPSGLIFQDFFARPFNDPQTKESTSREPSPITSFAPLAAHHGMMLSLNSGSGFGFQYPERNTPDRIIRPRPSQQLHVHAACPFGTSPRSSPLDPLGSPPSLPLKRPQENDESCKRLHKRLIKNRESAARSRARKQAYTTELELEVTQLLRENEKLRKQQNELLEASNQVPKKHSLRRTISAPF